MEGVVCRDQASLFPLRCQNGMLTDDVTQIAKETTVLNIDQSDLIHF